MFQRFQGRFRALQVRSRGFMGRFGGGGLGVQDCSKDVLGRRLHVRSRGFQGRFLNPTKIHSVPFQNSLERLDTPLKHT